MSKQLQLIHELSHFNAYCYKKQINNMDRQLHLRNALILMYHCGFNKKIQTHG